MRKDHSLRGTRALSKSQIKLTYLITDLKVGGVPLHLYRLATRLPPDRFRVRVISLSDEGPVGQMLRQAGIEVRGCGARSIRQAGSLIRLWRELAADPPDILHALLFHANMASRLVGPLAGITPGRILNEIQTVEIERRWHLLLDGLTCRLCRFEIGNSPSVVEHLHRKANVPLSRLCCKWGAVDVDSIAAATPSDRRDLGIAPGERLLLWTGRLDPIKGFEEMIGAVRLLKAKHRFKLLLAGEGPYRPVVERLILENDVNDRVFLLGRRSDVPSLLKTADLFVFCSRTEGLPNSVLEAMAAALPIVATRVPGCRDLITHMESGLLVQPESAQAIAQGVETLLTNSRLSSSLGSAAFNWVTRNADVRVWLTSWVRLYENLLKGF